MLKVEQPGRPHHWPCLRHCGRIVCWSPRAQILGRCRMQMSPCGRGSAIDVGVLHLPQRYLSTEVGNLTCWESAQEVEGFQM